MNFESLRHAQATQLPYEPIKYVYTQTIGSALQKCKEIIDPYVWTYEDILEPKILNDSSKAQYYLFHIAPIYNWLRKIRSSLLANYISLPQKSFNSLNKSAFDYQTQNDFKRFNFSSFSHQIKHCISQWQIVKLSACAKIKIITTKVSQTKNENNSQNSSKIQIFQQRHEQLKCSHLIKKQRFTSDYKLNNFVSDSIKLQCTSIYCQDCKQKMVIRSQIIRYPFAPYFQRFYGKQFSINDKSSVKIIYQLIIVYALQKTYIKSSGGVWYEIVKDRSFVISFDKIDIKSGVSFVYQQNAFSNKILKKAQSIEIISNQLKASPQNDCLVQDFQGSFQKVLHPIRNENTLKSSKIIQKIQTVSAKQNKNQALEEISKTSHSILLKKKRAGSKLFKEYKNAVEGLIPKPKQKDSYEKQYDRGKTKKIHKNRQQFRTANFFKIYNNIKNQLLNTDEQTDSASRIKLNYAAQHPNSRSLSEKQKNQDYNEVYIDKRKQRRNQGRFDNKKIGDNKLGKNGDQRLRSNRNTSNQSGNLNQSSRKAS